MYLDTTELVTLTVTHTQNQVTCAVCVSDAVQSGLQTAVKLKDITQDELRMYYGLRTGIIRSQSVRK